MAAPVVDIESKDKVKEPTYDDDGNIVVYRRRFAVLFSVALTYGVWNMVTARYISIVSAYARYFDTTNEANFKEGGGIDLLTLIDNGVLVFTYLPAAYIVDRYGLKMTIIGAAGIMVGQWIWYIGGDNYNTAVAARVVGSVSF